MNFDSLLFTRDGMCKSNFLELYDGFTIPERQAHNLRRKKICSVKDKVSLTSTSRRVVIRSFGSVLLNMPQLVVVATVLQPGKHLRRAT